MDNKFMLFIMSGKQVPYNSIVFDKSGIIPVIENYGIFVGKSIFGYKKYAFFSGHREDGESGYETALREYKEESGNVIKIDEDSVLDGTALIYLPEKYFKSLDKDTRKYMLQFLVYEGEMQNIAAEKFNVNTRLYYFVPFDFEGNISHLMKDLNYDFEKYVNQNKHIKTRNEMSSLYFLKFKDFKNNEKNNTFIVNFLINTLAKINKIPYCKDCYYKI